MLRNLVEFTLKYRHVVLTLGGVFCLFGFVALWNLPFDAFPDTTPTLVQVNVSAPGWAPEELEKLVTFPIEQTLTGLTGLNEVRSVTKYGLCQVTTIFEDGTDLYLARQQVSERLLTAEVPDGVGVPRLGPVSTGLGEIFHYIVIGPAGDPTEARTAQDWLIKPQLQAVPRSSMQPPGGTKQMPAGQSESLAHASPVSVQTPALVRKSRESARVVEVTQRGC